MDGHDITKVRSLALFVNSPGAYDGSDESRGHFMFSLIRDLCSKDEAQDIAEYAVMLAVILVLVVGTIRLVGGNSNNVFSSVASSIQ